ncbi:hypothetical protein ACFOEK_09735 [Litoribrevibacter euphylliae]|uniref:Uncharacterized protein n=1 Tax=Litoribrevibacter euphylliae TaxID=1834034 RepID=A0ABV7HBP2_9GAMM
MDEIRLLIALACFMVGVYLIYDLFASGFNVAVLIAGVGLLIAAHYIKPNRSDEEDGSLLWDILDFFIDIPFKTISLLLRGLGRASKGDADGFDL